MQPLCALPSPPAAVEWSRLLLHDIICRERVTMHFQWGGNLSLVILTFDHYIHAARDAIKQSKSDAIRQRFDDAADNSAAT